MIGTRDRSPERPRILFRREGGAGTTPPPPAPHVYIHTVVRGDTLWAIAEHYLDDPWRYRELAKLSHIKDPDLIYPGDRVRIVVH